MEYSPNRNVSIAASRGQVGQMMEVLSNRRESLFTDYATTENQYGFHPVHAQVAWVEMFSVQICDPSFQMRKGRPCSIEGIHDTSRHRGQMVRPTWSASIY